MVPPVASASTISVLNQSIDDEEGSYRVQYGNKVGYLTISTEVFDDDTMCRPYLLIPKLPSFPEREWTRLSIIKANAGTDQDDLEVSPTNDPLPEIETIWHPQKIDVLSLKRRKRYRSGVHGVMYNGVPAICKIAIFDWEIRRVERESWAYSILDRCQREEPNEPQLVPRVLGHLTECGRVIGLLLERLEGEYASPEDLPGCTDALLRLHEIGLTHGDVNRYNFIVNKQSGKVYMVDFEHASGFDEETAQGELESLPSELAEDTGRGKPRIINLEHLITP